MQLTKPANSPSHQGLLDAAEAAGHDRMVVRELFRLINAHPKLVAHALMPFT